MSRLTLTDAISQLGDTVVTGYALFPAGATTAQKRALINQVQERFLSMPSWKGLDGVVTFNVYDNMITLPRTIATIKKGGLNDEGCISSAPVHNIWYQFHANGPGVYDISNPRITGPAFQDMGLGFVTFRDPLNPFKLKIYTDVTESTANITFTGFDSSQVPIYTGTTLGVTLDVDTSGSETTQVFGALANVFKPVTNGRVKLYAVDNVTAEETLIAVYEPGETTINYRRYYVTGSVEELRTFKAICKRAYVPCIADNDLIFPDNLGAIKMGLQALNYENRDDRDGATYWWGQAINILNSELAEHQGDVSFSIQIQPGAFAGAGIRNLI